MSVRATLADPLELKWPCVDGNDETHLLELLENIFLKYKSCMRTIKRLPKWKKKDGDLIEDKLSEEEEQEKKCFKSWFVVGVQTVMKNLERDRLCAVLMHRDLQPAVLRKALLHLLSQHGCPAVCVSDILTPVQRAWPRLTSAAVLGVLKTEDPNDFDKLVEGVKAIATHVTTFAGIDKVSLGATEPDSSKVKIEIQDKNEDILVDTKPNLIIPPYQNPYRPKVDAEKFYIYKTAKSVSKSFSGQSFIAFDEGSDALGKVTIKTVKGVRVQAETGSGNTTFACFGIRPSLSGTDGHGSYIASTEERDHATGDYSVNIKKRAKGIDSVTSWNTGTRVINGIDSVSSKNEGNRKRKGMVKDSSGHVDNKKERQMESGYKGINMKRFQKNVQKKKKIKNKKNKK